MAGLMADRLLSLVGESSDTRESARLLLLQEDPTVDTLVEFCYLLLSQGRYNRNGFESERLVTREEAGKARFLAELWSHITSNIAKGVDGPNMVSIHLVIKRGTRMVVFDCFTEYSDMTTRELCQAWMGILDCPGWQGFPLELPPWCYLINGKVSLSIEELRVWSDVASSTSAEAVVHRLWASALDHRPTPVGLRALLLTPTHDPSPTSPRRIAIIPPASLRSLISVDAGPSENQESCEIALSVSRDQFIASPTPDNTQQEAQPNNIQGPVHHALESQAAKTQCSSSLATFDSLDLSRSGSQFMDLESDDSPPTSPPCAFLPPLLQQGETLAGKGPKVGRPRRWIDVPARRPGNGDRVEKEAAEESFMRRTSAGLSRAAADPLAQTSTGASMTDSTSHEPLVSSLIARSAGTPANPDCVAEMQKDVASPKSLGLVAFSPAQSDLTQCFSSTPAKAARQSSPTIIRMQCNELRNELTRREATQVEARNVLRQKLDEILALRNQTRGALSEWTDLQRRLARREIDHRQVPIEEPSAPLPRQVAEMQRRMQVLETQAQIAENSVVSANEDWWETKGQLDVSISRIVQ